jgi:hypothetical protein
LKLKKELKSEALHKRYIEGLKSLMKESMYNFENEIFEDLKDNIIRSKNPI